MGKRIKIILVFVSMVMFFTIGCKKDSNILTTKMSATIDGKNWNSTTRVTVKNSTGFIITAQQVSTTLVTSSLVVRIGGFNTGTYNVIATNNTCLGTYTPNIETATESYISATGTVNLTEVNTGDKTISGTFEFTCANLSLQTVSVASGSFKDLKYQETSDN